MREPMEMERIFKNLPQKKADLILLILASQNIDTRVEKQPDPSKSGRALQFDILVSREQAAGAIKSVEQYFRENKFFGIPKKIQAFEISSFNTPAAYTIMVLLVAVHLTCLKLNLHREMIFKFGASSLYIGQGETYRAITALFLHSDGQHLLGNLGGMLIFAAPLITLTGYGTGPFLLLCAGASGNLVNAYFRQTALLSIGASTAVMGAAGALAAYQILNSSRPFQSNRLIPLFAGATRVGLFSQGENTDISAHFFGFMAGSVWGGVFFPFFKILRKTVGPGRIEPVALLLVLFILGSAIWDGL